MRSRNLFIAIALLSGSGIFATGGFIEAGTMYQNSQSLFGSGDTASVNGKYFAMLTGAGYEGKTWAAGFTAPFAGRTTSAEYYYQSTNQRVTGTVSESGAGDPSFWGIKDLFGGNRYAPAVTATASASAPFGKTLLSLQTWQVRPGVALEYPAGLVSFSLRTYAAIPFAPKSGVEGQYHAYGGAIFSAGVPVFQTLGAGAELSYAAGDFVRTDTSLRVGGYLTFSIPPENVSVYAGSQTEVVRSDRDFFFYMSVRYQNIRLPG